MAPKKTKSEQLVELIEVALIDTNTQNPRRIQDNASMEELSASIKAHGVLMPILVRPVGKRFVVVAGERRLAAAKKLKLVSIPAQIKVMTVDEAYEASVAENVTRSDMNPADECEAVRRMVQDSKSRAEIAARFGKTVMWVARREKIAGLGDDVLCMIREGRMPLAHAEELCRLAHEDQVNELAPRCITWSLDILKRHIDGMMRNLSDAPWDLDAKFKHSEHGRLRTCQGCPSRTDKQTDLFGACEAGKALCMDEACWNAKKECFHADKVIEKLNEGYTIVPEAEEHKARAQWGSYLDPEHPVDGKVLDKMIEAGIKPRVIVEDDGSITEVYCKDDLPDDGAEEEQGGKNGDSASKDSFRLELERKRAFRKSLVAVASNEVAHLANVIPTFEIIGYIAEIICDSTINSPLDKLLESVNDSGDKTMYTSGIAPELIRDAMLRTIVEITFENDNEAGLAMLELLGIDRAKVLAKAEEMAEVAE